MIMKFNLISMEGHHPINKESAPAFYYLIQQAALLGLKDIGCLSEMQYRSAESALLQQYREVIKKTGSEAFYID